MTDPELTRAAERVRLTIDMCENAMELLRQAVEELRSRAVIVLRGDDSAEMND